MIIEQTIARGTRRSPLGAFSKGIHLVHSPLSLSLSRPDFRRIFTSGLLPQMTTALNRIMLARVFINLLGALILTLEGTRKYRQSCFE